MNITIIYESIDKTNTYNCVQLLLNKLKLNINIQTTEFFLTQDSIYYEYSSNYTHYMQKCYCINDISSIAKSIIQSDLIIFASQISACDISADMKTVLNSLSLYITNKSTYQMNNKIGIAISSTAGAGLFNSIRTLKRNLNFLGISNTFKFSKTLYELNWEYINSKTKKQLSKKILELSYKILNTYSSLHPVTFPLLIDSSSSVAKPVLKNKTYNIINFNSLKKHKNYHRKNIG